MIRPMRDKRAMFAGLGTVTMLAGAVACVFILGSAVVAFKGWPGGRVDTPPVTNRALVVRDGVDASRAQLAAVQRDLARRDVELVEQRAARAGTRARSASRSSGRPLPRSTRASAPTTRSSPTGGAAVPGSNATPPLVAPPPATTPKAVPGAPPKLTDGVRRPSDITRSADRQLDLAGERIGVRLDVISPVVGATVRRVADQLGDVLADAGRNLDRSR